MNRYTIYCTEEQTRKALELGSPITNVPFGAYFCIPDYYFKLNNFAVEIPTAEQMIGWLEEKGILIDFDTEWNKSVLVYAWDCENKSLINHVFHGSRKEATLAAIDAALEHLTSKK